MVNCAYNFANFDYKSTDELVSVEIEFTRNKDSTIHKSIWNWKGEHSLAQGLGLDNKAGETFSGKDIQVVLGIKTTGERIPIQVCAALEKMEEDTIEEWNKRDLERKESKKIEKEDLSA